jgi:hypothetical protein
VRTGGGAGSSAPMLGFAAAGRKQNETPVVIQEAGIRAD